MATRVSDEPLWSAASRSSNREPAASGMACDPQTEKQTRVLVFGATRKTRRRTFQYYQNRASAPARLQIQRAQIQSAIKYHTFNWYFSVNIFCRVPDGWFRSGRPLAYRWSARRIPSPLLRAANADGCSDAFCMTTAL